MWRVQSTNYARGPFAGADFRRRCQYATRAASAMRASWARWCWLQGLPLLLGLCWAACDGPGGSIVLGPLPERPMHAGDEDGGVFDLPEGARACTSDADCADRIDCTIDVCLPAHYCSNELDNSQCSDGLVCNGVESCDPLRGCITAPPPSCDDQDSCTIDRCDEATKACVHGPRDFDRDGEIDYHCGTGTDCDDFDATRGMSAREICGDEVDNDCDERIDEADCGPVPHDNCADPLDISAGGVFEVSTVGALSDHVVSCNSEAASRDVVFSFRIDEPRDIKLVASGLRGDDREDVTSLSLQRSCGAFESELQCSHGFPGDLRVRALPAGQYSLVVSTTLGVRSVVLTATFSPATSAPPNQTCEQATDISRGGHFAANFVDIPDSTMSSCSVENQPDLYYTLTLTEKSDLEVSVIGDETASLAVALRKGGCVPDATEVRCELGARVLSHHHELDPGDYILVLQGPSSREIGFGLDVSILPPTPPPAGDSCKQVLPITFGQTQRVSLIGLQKDIASRCQSTGPDAVLSFTLDTPQDIEITVAAPEDAQAVVMLQTTCGDPTTERYCRAGTSLKNRVYGLPAGEYFLVAQADTATAVDVRVDVRPAVLLTAVSGNDTCSMAFDIPLTGGLFQGNTRTLMPTYTATCGGGALSADAAYRLVLPTTKHVVATVDALFDSVLLRYDTSAGMPICQGPETRCIDDSEGSMSRLDEVLGPGTYYYIVDGYRSMNDGEYVLLMLITDSP